MSRRAIPFDMEVALGQVPAWEAERKFGFNAAVGTSEETIWKRGGTINWPSSASVMKVSSSSGNDDLVGTGAQKMKIYGLDSNWDLAEEEVDLDGQTQVTTDTSFIRVFRAIVTQAGTGGVNAGVIYVYTGAETNGVPDTATNIYTSVEIGDNQTLQCAYSIPRKYTALLKHVAASTTGAGNTGVTGRVKVREFGGVFAVKEQFVMGTPDNYHDDYGVPLQIPEKSDIMFTGEADTTDVDMSASFELQMVHDADGTF